MGKLSRYIGSQFGSPRGFVGRVCCLIMNVINNQMYRRTLSIIRQQEIHSVLDVGYGNGYLLKRLDRCGKPELFGIDISPDMRVQAESRCTQALKDGRLHLRVGDCCALPYDAESFDAVTSINTIYFWQDTVQGLREIRRTLKPGGTFYNVAYTRQWLQKLSYTKEGFRFFEPEDYIRLGKEAGFAKVTVTPIAKRKSLMVCFQTR